ncbi:MAG: TMEM165/GDT1 family protein [Rhodospirillaceae bacterium]|jgi:putative Ca2+/H+ antiporter (TMEM165/GDT1 family)|nr:TMEM165/GDT1 family protein [Rhodospirillaceae bacterium]MBT4590156.1 TMEM165/GDT1 family protein [Rhodospirillaceae bacterium]MBT4941101.1 TMEM165/GDT1 family protein [Rhodospirillaceae bacterium]MBT5940543.1 TMEM165/GDT1 family protein [Rhodospirillaceae bacterium]MBT7269156.1 TMEM165/GDT1 family protein [Rhodospirillaceae bacterium]
MLKLASVFAVVFIAEMGDKTQLATLLFASDKNLNPFMVFLAASAALVATTAIAVLLGSLATRYIDMLPLNLIAGIGFIAIGVWSVAEHFGKV